MTLPSRKKLQTTLQNTPSPVRGPKQQRQRALRSWILSLLLIAPASPLAAQMPTPPTWQPQRLPAAGQMQPLPSVSVAAPGNQIHAQPALPSSSTTAANGDSGVVLRWRTSSRVNGTPNQTQQASAHTLSNPNSGNPNSGNPNSGSSASAALQASTAEYRQQPQHMVSSANPLRSPASSSALSPVRPAAYQAPGLMPPINNQSVLEDDRGFENPQPPALPPSFPPTEPPALPPALPSSGDELSMPEQAPLPPSQTAPNLGGRSDVRQAPPPGDATRPTPLPGADDFRLQDPPRAGLDPFERRQRADSDSPSDRRTAEGRSNNPADSRKGDALANCESFREQLRSATLDRVNLNSAPRFGQGLNDNPETSEKQRLDFAASATVRQWCNRSGQSLVEGRLVDMVNEQVVLDVNGTRREIPLRDLCDSDLAYVGRAWNLPVTCGSGYDAVAGRAFVPSAMQWKAPGLCHKPLYFEEVQLERYGHEVGPVLQPLISTAHFFGNIAVLPYKMGIHPPHECQYALGYYRPGDCAPYMLPPIPWSLRGAAVQAGAVVGAAALVP